MSVVAVGSKGPPGENLDFSIKEIVMNEKSGRPLEWSPDYKMGFIKWINEMHNDFANQDCEETETGWRKKQKEEGEK